MEEIISLVFDEIISLFFLVVAAWYGLYRLLRALWEHDNSSENRKKGLTATSNRGIINITNERKLTPDEKEYLLHH